MKISTLRRQWSRMRAVPGLRRDIASIAILILIALVATGIVLSNTEFVLPWQERELIHAEFKQAPAVNPQSTHKVSMAGVEVGKISDWHVTNHGTAVLDLSIDPGHPVFTNARAVLRSVNPLNEMYVEINPGGPPGKPLPQKGVIPARQTQRPIQADEVLRHLDQRTQLAITNTLVESDAALVRAPQELPPGMDATTTTLQNVRPVMDALQHRRTQISQLVTALSQISSAIGKNDERTARLVNSTQQTLTTLTGNDAQLRASLQQLPGLSDQLRSALTSTQRLTSNLNPALDNLHTASKDLPPALERLNSTVGQVGKTVDAARPAVEAARPVVSDLRPLVGDVDQSLHDIRPITQHLGNETATLTSYLTDLKGFVFNTSSVFGLQDAQGGFIRGHVVVPLPDAGLLPGGAGGWAPPPADQRPDPPRSNPLNLAPPVGGPR